MNFDLSYVVIFDTPVSQASAATTFRRNNKKFVWVGRQGPNVYATKDPLQKSVVVVELFKGKSKLFTRVQ